jgi:hypothetical protein
LFEENIKTIDLRHEGGEGMPPRFLDYTGGCNYEVRWASCQLFLTHSTLVLQAAKTYIIERFKELPRRERTVFTHVTCATDTANVRVVFNACKETILQQNLRGSGFME